MKPSFSSLSRQEKQWLDTYLNGTIAPGNFEKMQDHMIQDHTFCRIARLYLSLNDSLFTLGEEGHDFSQSWQSNTATAPKKTPPFLRLIPLAAAASLAEEGPRHAFIGRFSQRDPTRVLHRGSPENPRDEVSPAAFTVMNGTLGLAHLLAKENDPANLSGKSPIRPSIDPDSPYLPRPSHFEAPAKRVLVIYCPGAVSQNFGG
ncbi:MAG: hypothetical protein ACJAVK_002344 [Akkermansiaceae bacterium]|jgi:hypothetical protein